MLMVRRSKRVSTVGRKDRNRIPSLKIWRRCSPKIPVSAVSLNCRHIPRSQQPSPSMGEGLGGVTVPLQRRRKEGHPIPASHFLLQRNLHARSGAYEWTRSDTRMSRAAIWRTSPPPDPPPSRGRASGRLAHASLNFAFLAQFYNCIFETLH